jgi:hypothetical protein
MACGKGCNDWLDELSSQLADMNDCSCFYHTMWIHKNRVLENDVLSANLAPSHRHREWSKFLRILIYEQMLQIFLRAVSD